MKPLRNFVLLEEIKNSEQTASGIILGENVDQEPTYQARVIQVGPDVSDVGEENIVLIQRHLFNEITFEKKQYLIGKSDGIIAIC